MPEATVGRVGKPETHVFFFCLIQKTFNTHFVLIVLHGF